MMLISFFKMYIWNENF